ncbi:MAG: sigma-70 family RNA polymerase sigma factor [Acidobacteriota bacterium]
MDSSAPAGSQAITRLLSAWRGGDEAALEALTPLVYQELHRLARGYMRRESEGHLLQATALVNEAFVRLVGAEIGFRDREHFFALAAKVMRRVLVDFARRRAADKRGGDATALTLDEERMTPLTSASLLELDDALRSLAGLEPRQSRMVELRYFGGMTAAEISSYLEVSTATVERDLRAARAWLHLQLGAVAPSAGP